MDILVLLEFEVTNLMVDFVTISYYFVDINYFSIIICIC